ncbi:hypothetical protein [Bacillus thuringiensis]|uniref:hypothetical protein n=1 Tax=Bacillus thuringiensis TaxID=1428 RepID=UPI000B43A94D|nr:hypothetical protein [Bacillus thuringiensis]MED3181214.1 hypothetical protein [Bacillus thuringiensis]OTY05494.1 hypothetical protein BK734_22945 [Bacillus thuringiensis serovar kim]OUB13797.1 hypothetical protein BK733_26985 [Bacillus thuringiensis serovar xiaguangiensis]
MSYYPDSYYSMNDEYYLRPTPQVSPYIGPGALQQQQPSIGPGAIQPHIGPGAIQPQPGTGWPTPPWPPVPPTGQGCMHKWAQFRLKDGRVIRMYVTHIDSKSVAGSVWVPGAGWKQVGLDLDEILESQC